MNTTTEYLLRQRIAELEADIEHLIHDRAYGCYTRQGLERMWQGGGSVIFGDIDGMHEMNADLGYDGVDALIRTALDGIKTRPDVGIACRWLSGDELVFTLPTEDAKAFAARILAAFAAHGLSITLGIAEAGSDLSASVARASGLVQAAKEAGGRGRVHGTDHDG